MKYVEKKLTHYELTTPLDGEGKKQIEMVRKGAKG